LDDSYCANEDIDLGLHLGKCAVVARAAKNETRMLPKQQAALQFGASVRQVPFPSIDVMHPYRDFASRGYSTDGFSICIPRPQCSGPSVMINFDQLSSFPIAAHGSAPLSFQWTFAIKQ